MAFILRRPFAITGSLLRELPKTTTSVTAAASSKQATISRTTFRAFQTHSHKPSPNSSSSSTFKSTRSTFSPFTTPFQNAFRRSYQTPSPAPSPGGSTSPLTQRLFYGGAIFGGTLLAINLIFNSSSTSESRTMPPFERSYLNDTFLHTGLGIGIIAVASRALHTSGWSLRLMSANPWLVLGVGLVGSIGTMMGCRATPPENYMVKYGLWTAFNLTQAALLSPMMFFAPAILARAGLYTVGVMGSIALVGATAREDKYLYLGGPLLAGVAVVALSGLAPMVLPATAVRTLMWTENIWLYGGLAVFGGFTLYDVQKVLAHARMAERGMMKRDPVNESISLELDFINIFVRMVQILAMQQGSRRR